MSPALRLPVAALLAALSLPAMAEPGPALRPELFLSSDSDGNHSQRSALGWDVRREDIEHWWGFKAERARYSGDGWREVDERLFVRAAGGEGKWRWTAEAGTDGDDLLGSASVFSDTRPEPMTEVPCRKPTEGLVKVNFTVSGSITSLAL